MGQKVKKAGVSKKSGYLYYVDKQGDIAEVKMARGGKGKGKPKKVSKTGVKKESGYLYYVDKDGDVGRSKMARGRKKK